MVRQPKYKAMQHQIEASEFIKPLDYFALFMEQGTGKSKVVMMKAFQLYQEGKIDRLLVICPGAVKYQWAGEVPEEHSHLEYEALFYDGFGSNRGKDEFRSLIASKKFKILSIHYEAFQYDSVKLWVKMFLQQGQALVICDESTKIKNPESIRGKKIVNGFAKRAYKGILTGTPTPNSPIDLYNQFEFLRKGFWGMDYFAFRKTFCIMMKKNNPNTGRPMSLPLDEDTWWVTRRQLIARIEERGRDKPTLDDYEVIAALHSLNVKDIMIIYQQEEYTPHKNLEQLWAMIGPYTFAVKKKDCLDLPDKVYEKLEVTLSSEQKRVMKELSKHLITSYEGETLTSSNVIASIRRKQCITGGLFPYQVLETDSFGMFDLKTKYKRMKDSPKIKTLLEDMETVPKGTSIIVWAIFIEELKWIHESVKAAGYACELYIGETTNRKEIEEGFKNKDFQVLVINPGIGEMGLNFQVCTLQYFYSNDYMADRRLQAEDRSHRLNQINKVTYKDIICIDSIDIRILKALRVKENLIEYFRKKPEILLIA